MVDTDPPRLLLTFDDRFVDEWCSARRLWREYGAKVTFFVYAWDQLTSDQIRRLQELRDDGHTIGCHSLRHQKVPDYVQQHGPAAYVRDEIDPCLALMRAHGFSPRSFAYPNSRRTVQTDELLFGVFDRLRTGTSISSHLAEEADLPAEIFIPANECNTRRLLTGVSLDVGSRGRVRTVSPPVLQAAIKRTAAMSGMVVFYAHAIAETHPENFTSLEVLDAILGYAKKAGVSPVGFDDLPAILPNKISH